MNKEQLDNLLIAEEPKEQKQSSHEFNPKYNVREEFAIWVRNQFPDLERYAKKNQEYPELEERREEVYQAALGAVNHGTNSTEACANQRLYSGWKGIQKWFGTNSKKRARGLEAFVRALEDLSVSLGGDEHFTEAGTFLSGGSYNRNRRGHLNAFVYRNGEENSQDTKYLVFDEKQDNGSENNLILIGELTRLTEFDIKNLRKITKKFKGPEVEFIERVDRIVPEQGAHTYSTYSSYGNSYSRNRDFNDKWLDLFSERKNSLSYVKSNLSDDKQEEDLEDSLFTSRGREAYLARRLGSGPTANKNKSKKEK